MGEISEHAQLFGFGKFTPDRTAINPIVSEAKTLGLLKDSGKPTAFGKWLQLLDGYTDQFTMNGPKQQELAERISSKEQGLQQLFDQVDHKWNWFGEKPDPDTPPGEEKRFVPLSDDELHQHGFQDQQELRKLRSTVFSGYADLERDVQQGRFEPELLDKARIRSMASALVAKDELTNIVDSVSEVDKVKAQKLFATQTGSHRPSYQLHWERLISNMQNPDPNRRFSPGEYPGDRQIPSGVLDLSAKLVGFGAQLEQAEHNGFLDILKESKKTPAIVESQQDFIPATSQKPSNAEHVLSMLADSQMRIPSFMTTEFTVGGFHMHGDLMTDASLFHFKNSKEFFATSPVIQHLRSLGA